MIIYIMRFVKAKKLELRFIKCYGRDTVFIPSVWNNLYKNMDRDLELECMAAVHSKIKSVLMEEMTTE